MREQKPLNSMLSVCFLMCSHKNALAETSKLYVSDVFSHAAACLHPTMREQKPLGPMLGQRAVNC